LPRPRIMNATAFGVIVALCYSIALVPSLRRAHWDTSVFIVAGDLFVDSSKLDAPIIVRKHSDGYDGEFYYRLAVEPWASTSAAHGVTFDGAFYRAQRILYPVLAWAVSLGNAALVPVALVGVNLMAVGVVGGMAVALRDAAKLSVWFPFTVVLWPGFLTTITHDTTELVPQALVMAALWAWASGRTALFAVFASLAPLAREVTILVPAGFCLWSAAAWPRDRTWPSFARVIVCGLALLPFLVWREALILSLHAASGPGNNIGWPGVGFVETVGRILSPASYPRLPELTGGLGWRMALALVGVAGLLVATARHVQSALQNKLLAPTVIAWSLTAALITLLRTDGPWIDDIAIFRALTEYYTLSIVVLAAASASWFVMLPVMGVAGLLAPLVWFASIRSLSF
jgi:hypothetical protein